MVVVTGRYRRAGQRGRHVGLWETRLVSAVSPPKHAGGQTNQARLAAAVALHQQGRLTEAEALYRDILRRDPNHFDALHLCGVAALQARRTAEGVALVRDAIALMRNKDVSQLLVTVTERRTKDEIDHYVAALKEVLA